MGDRINDGGPAFPQHLFAPVPGGGGYWTQEGGMTLRDWFAGQALAGLLSDNQVTGPTEQWADTAYNLADAMLAARVAK